MKLRGCVVALAVALAAGGGCASIVDSGNESLQVASNPPGAKASITNSDTKKVVHEGTTPFTVSLDRNDGYFDGADYIVTVTKEGFEPQSFVVASGINGWYFGNLLFGGLIGFLIVDPATGSMYTLKPDEIDANLIPLPAAAVVPPTPAPAPQTALPTS
jgi:hypothetical protein